MFLVGEAPLLCHVSRVHAWLRSALPLIRERRVVDPNTHGTQQPLLVITCHPQTSVGSNRIRTFSWACLDLAKKRSACPCHRHARNMFSSPPLSHTRQDWRGALNFFGGGWWWWFILVSSPRGQVCLRRAWITSPRGGLIGCTVSRTLIWGCSRWTTASIPATRTTSRSVRSIATTSTATLMGTRTPTW